MKIAKFGGAQVLVLLLPQIKRRLTNAHLATNLVDGVSQLILLQGVRNLLFAELASLHGMCSFLSIENSHRKFCN
jgi:hypothetical protein